jgi:hypothetical protein
MTQFIPMSDAERFAILSIPITNWLSIPETEWILVGAMQRQSKGVWTYGFANPSNYTMYSIDTGIRRKATTSEVEEALRFIEKNTAADILKSS